MCGGDRRAAALRARCGCNVTPRPAPLQIAEFVAAIRKPRAIIILVQAGKPVDDTIEVRLGGGGGLQRAGGLCAFLMRCGAATELVSRS